MNRNEKFKIDSIINANNKQVQQDFILEIHQKAMQIEDNKVEFEDKSNQKYMEQYD